MHRRSAPPWCRRARWCSRTTPTRCWSRPRRGRSRRARSTSRSSRATRSCSATGSSPASASSSRAECCSVIDWIVSFALRKRLVAVMICVFAAAYGYYSWTELAIEAYPDVADTAAQVVTQAPGLAAEEVEQQVTIPLERELVGTPRLAMMRSRSTFGLSLITLVFRDGTEDYWSRQRIMERIQGVTLPPGLSPGLDPLSSPTGQILYYILQSDTKNLRELSEIEQWKVIPSLKQVPGVADVSNFGGVTTQFQLELDPQQLLRFNLSLNSITAAISANSASAGGSVL